MLSKIFQFVKTHADTIIIGSVVVLLALLSFATGYIIARYQAKEPIKIENSIRN